MQFACAKKYLNGFNKKQFYVLLTDSECSVLVSKFSPICCHRKINSAAFAVRKKRFVDCLDRFTLLMWF